MDRDVAFGQRLPRVAVPPPGPRSRELAGRLARVESRNVTFAGQGFPVFWERAAGANVEDVDGNVYVDLTAAFGVSIAGHGHPCITAAIEEQTSRLVHGMGDAHPPATKVLLMERLAALAPWSETRCVLASAGSEAVEIALKTAQLATGRVGVLAFEGAYHGLTLGALSTTHRDHFRGPFAARLPGGVRFAPWATEATEVAGALDRIERMLGGDDAEPVAAVILEPVQGRAGVRIPAAGFVKDVARLTRSAGALLVFDEIFTGLGRTGRLFAMDWEGVTPDLFCLGKALGGGMPISACLGPASVMAAWPESTGEAIHTSTFLGHPVGCAAALAFLDVLEETELVDRSLRLGVGLRDELADRLERAPAVREVRGRGTMIGVELSLEGRSRPGGAPGIVKRLLGSGYLTLAAGAEGEVLQLTPPATLTDAQAVAALDAVAGALAS